jgi:hypothetical protein
MMLQPEARPGRRIALIASLHAELSAEHRERIVSLGGHVRTAAGTIISLELPVSSLEALTDLDVVQYIEPSGPLFPEEGPAHND